MRRVWTKLFVVAKFFAFPTERDSPEALTLGLATLMRLLQPPPLFEGALPGYYARQDRQDNLRLRAGGTCLCSSTSLSAMFGCAQDRILSHGQRNGSLFTCDTR